jgi:hypothetical protein
MSTPLPWTTPFHGRAQVGANLLTPAASPPLVAEVDSIPDDISALLNDLHSNHISVDGSPLEKDAEYEEVSYVVSGSHFDYFLNHTRG